MTREDCWCSEDEEYVAGVLEAKFIMWRLCAGVFRRKGCDVKRSVCLKWVNVVIGVLVFAGIVFLILFGMCLCLLRAGSEADDRMRELFEERKDR